jgi:GTP-binding protein
MLTQSGAFSEHQKEGENRDRVMDSMDLEREKGITILAKNTSIRRGAQTVNIIDTPGHADFGGEVERGLEMVDGVILLVDASEGPLPQTRFVLRKALEKNLPVILVINKVDRPDSRIPEVVDEAYGLFMDLDANDDQIEFPVVYASAKAGRASMNRPENGAMPDRENLDALFEVIFNTIPAPVYHEGAPLQAHVTNLDSSPYLGRLALCRIREGVIKKGENVMWMKTDGTSERVKISELLITDGLERVPALEAGPGDIVAIAGIETITLGETLADLEKPHALPLIIVDEPSISMTIGINTSPIAGQEGKLLTARQVKNRLDAELIGNVSLRVLNTERPDTWEVQGRGELQLAVLVEIMRREGFELTVGKPQVVVKTVDGKLQEPMERLSIDIPDDYLGVVTQLMALRKGRMEQMVNHGTGWIRMDYKVPSRGLIGFRTEFLTETRGTGLLHHVFDGYENWNGEIRTRLSGSLVADRRGTVTAYAVDGVQERGVIFLEVGTEVYEGMIVGENSRTEDMDVNIVREKKLTNMRSSGADDANRIIPPRLLNLEQALEFCREDECVEVTPKHVRVRKTILDQNERARNVGRAKKVNLNAE